MVLLLRQELGEFETDVMRMDGELGELRGGGDGVVRTAEGQIKAIVGGEEPVYGVRLRERHGDCDGAYSADGRVDAEIRHFQSGVDLAKFVVAYDVLGGLAGCWDYMNEPYAVGDWVRLVDGAYGQVKHVGVSAMTADPVIGIRMCRGMSVESLGGPAHGTVMSTTIGGVEVMTDRTMARKTCHVSDGLFEGERAFECPSGHGLFLTDCGYIVDKSVDEYDGRCWVLSSTSMRPRECRVVDTHDARLLVHFVSYHSKYDEWIALDSARFIGWERPLSDAWHVDDVCYVYHVGYEAWLVAEVEDVQADSVKMRYVGTPTAEWMQADSERISRVAMADDAPYRGSAVEEEVRYVDADKVYALTEEERAECGGAAVVVEEEEGAPTDDSICLIM